MDMGIITPGFDNMIIVRGGGDLATGVVQKLFRARLPVLILETPAPTAIRRSVSLCEAIYDGVMRVEDITSKRVAGPDEMEECFRKGLVPVIADPAGDMISILRPAAVIDAIVAKRNLGTNRDMAGVTIALGPGFYAGRDVHAVIETQRGHNLGRLILQGHASPDTGNPGSISGESARRVLHAPVSGIVVHNKRIGDVVECGETLFMVGREEIRAPFTGLLRGLIREMTEVYEGMKIADVDPRTDVDWRTISDKARCIGGTALEAYYMLRNRK